MVENDIDIGGFESLTQLKKSVQNEKIQKRIYQEYAKTPIGKEPNRKKLAKMIGVSENTISMAFEETAKPKQLNDFSNTLTKALAISTPMLLLQEGNIERISNFLEENAEITAVGTGLFFFWQQFIKPRINDPKNDLSEIEIMIELFKSNAAQGLLAGLFGFGTIKALLPLLDGLGDKIRDGLINFQSSAKEVIDDVKEIIEEARENVEEAVIEGYEFVRDLFKLQKIVSIGSFPYPTFPSYEEWLLEQPKALQLTYKISNGVVLGISLYRNQKKSFIDKHGQSNVFDFKDLEQAVLERERTTGVSTSRGQGDSDMTIDQILAEQEREKARQEQEVQETRTVDEILEEQQSTPDAGGGGIIESEIEKGKPQQITF